MGSRVVVCLEGLNGVGKSATARVLARELGVPIVRAFRHDATDVHLGREQGRGRLDELRALGVPANTYVDDIYTADLLVGLGLSAVLDRSMASATAYGLLYGDVRTQARAQALAEAWQEQWGRYKGQFLYVHMTARPEVMAARTDGRWSPNDKQNPVLEREFTRVFRSLHLPKLHLDTSDSPDAADNARRIVDTLRRADAG
jgi:predicted kinase